MIRLLDCTLRDGGYINDWKFGEKAIQNTVLDLTETGVDIIELGFLKNEPANYERTVFNEKKQMDKLIPPHEARMHYAAMIEVVNPIPLQMLQAYDGQGVDIIRVIVWKTKHDADGNEVDALEEGLAYCRGVVERGYKLCVQPARVEQYSDDEFVNMLQMFQQLNPMAIYVVDSWGTQSAENVLHYARLADQTLNPGIALGYHGHNNMMQAFDVAGRFIREGFQRDLIVDASVYGIGRGAGNLNLELIARYLNETQGTHYDIAPMIRIYEECVRKIYQEQPWGYSVPYFLTAQYGCNPNYGSFYGYEMGLTGTQIQKILSRISQEDKVLFSKEKARKYYTECLMEGFR